MFIYGYKYIYKKKDEKANNRKGFVCNLASFQVEQLQYTEYWAC